MKALYNVFEAERAVTTRETSTMSVSEKLGSEEEDGLC